MNFYITICLLLGVSFAIAQDPEPAPEPQETARPWDAVLIVGNKEFKYKPTEGTSNEDNCKRAPQYPVYDLYDDDGYCGFYQTIRRHNTSIVQFKTSLNALVNTSLTYTSIFDLPQDCPSNHIVSICNGFYYTEGIQSLCFLCTGIVSQDETTSAAQALVLLTSPPPKGTSIF